jgi:hypothetical protein
MNPDQIRWVAMRGLDGREYQVFSGPWGQLERVRIPEQQKLGFETVAVVDTEAEAWKWIEVHRDKRP